MKEKWLRLFAEISGEMSVESVPLAQGVNLDALKKGDDDPLEVVVEVPVGKSKRGWNYTGESLNDIVKHVNAQTLNGFLGHQKTEDLATEFKAPVTHWVGAKYQDNRAYFRGVVDKAAGDLKRWIRAGRVKQVSIFGKPALKQAAGEVQVTGYDPWSIDWTPLDRPGMPTKVVAVAGEMWDDAGEGPKGVDPGKQRGGDPDMTLQELAAELRKLGVKPGQVIGEMGWDTKAILKDSGAKLEDVAGEIDSERWKRMEAAVEAVGEMAEVFGMGKDAKLTDLVAKAKTAHEAETKAQTAEHDKVVDKVIGEMVVAESARPIVKRMLQVKPDADEAAIKKAVGEMLEEETVKTALAGVFKESVVNPVDSSRKSDDQPTGLKTKRTAI